MEWPNVGIIRLKKLNESEDSDHEMKSPQSTGEAESERQVTDQRQGNRWFGHD